MEPREPPLGVLVSRLLVACLLLACLSISTEVIEPHAPGLGLGLGQGLGSGSGVGGIWPKALKLQCCLSTTFDARNGSIDEQGHKLGCNPPRGAPS